MVFPTLKFRKNQITNLSLSFFKQILDSIIGCLSQFVWPVWIFAILKMSLQRYIRGWCAQIPSHLNFWILKFEILWNNCSFLETLPLDGATFYLNATAIRDYLKKKRFFKNSFSLKNLRFLKLLKKNFKTLNSLKNSQK